MKSLNFVIPLQVYPFDVMVSMGQTEDQLKRSLKKYNLTYSEGMKLAGTGKYLINDTNQSLIRTLRVPRFPEDYATLQHEIFHAVTYVLDRMGMKLVLRKSDEAYSYLVGYLTEQIYKRLDV